MGRPSSPEDETRMVLRGARELLGELVEEGLEALPATSSGARPETSPPGRTARTAQRPAADEASPGEDRAAPLAPEPEQTTIITGSPSWGERPTLDHVRTVLGDCTRCALSQGRTQIVFHDGNPEADLMFVGEGPGQQEDLRGIPFCGRAGELLTSMIEKGLGIARSEVYICNIVKCRPPDNRTPLPAEVAACRPFLDGQIDAVQPRVIVTLGKPAASTLLGREVAITKLRGTWQEYRGIPLMPTLHPAFVLRQYTPENRRLVWEDLKAALARSREPSAS